jgi:hypothetical protein
MAASLRRTVSASSAEIEMSALLVSADQSFRAIDYGRA